MHKDKNKFTLEEMLSLKKAEKPSAAQWEDFNAQLKSKMLKAMVSQEAKPRFFFSLWTFAKIGAIAMPVLGIMFTFLLRPASIETLSLQKSMELVQIPDMETSYYSDNYFTSIPTSTQYSQNMIQGESDTNIVYANNDVLAFKNFSF